MLTCHTYNILLAFVNFTCKHFCRKELLWSYDCCIWKIFKIEIFVTIRIHIIIWVNIWATGWQYFIIYVILRVCIFIDYIDFSNKRLVNMSTCQFIHLIKCLNTLLFKMAAFNIFWGFWRFEINLTLFKVKKINCCVCFYTAEEFNTATLLCLLCFDMKEHMTIKWPSQRYRRTQWSDVQHCSYQFLVVLLLFAHFAAVPKVIIMWVDVALCGLIMSKCLRGQMRKYQCWRVRGASLHASALCPLQSLSCCTAQWPRCCHSMRANGWPTYTLCPQTGRRLAVSATMVRRSAETAQSCTRSHSCPQMKSKL